MSLAPRSRTSFCSFSLFRRSFSSRKAINLAFFLSSSAFLSAMVNVWPGMAKALGKTPYEKEQWRAGPPMTHALNWVQEALIHSLMADYRTHIRVFITFCHSYCHKTNTLTVLATNIYESDYWGRGGSFGSEIGTHNTSQLHEHQPKMLTH